MLAWIQDFDPEAESLLLFNCGLHDIKRFGKGNVYVPIEEYKENINHIAQTAMCKWTSAALITTTPIDDERHKKYCQDFTRRNEDVIRYNEVAMEIMEKHKIPVIDLYLFTARCMECQQIYMDHVHMKKEVSEQQACFIADEVERIFS